MAGNHDVWSGDGDPIEFIMRDQPALYQKHGARMNLVFPNGRQIRISARHQFKGNSMWNTAHSITLIHFSRIRTACGTRDKA